MSKHECGGTVARATDGHHYYCDRCGAFSFLFELGEPFPTGTDRWANRIAWGGGKARSPNADRTVVVG